MTGDKDDVHRPRAYGFERLFFRHIPWAALLLAVGIWMQFDPPRFPRQGGTVLAGLLAAASFAYIAWALWRRFVEPGRPRVVLTAAGIDQRLSRGRILHIPWDEVRGVTSTEHTAMNVVGIWQTAREITAVAVSPEFYDRAMPRVPWIRRPLDFGHFSRDANGAVQILFRPDYLGTQGKDLRQAIETRWRAFSRHPNAKLPPAPAEARRRAGLGVWVYRWSAPALLAFAALGALYLLFVKGPTMTEGTRSAFLGELLDQGGVPARLADGRMANVRRGDVAAAGIPACDREPMRDSAGAEKPGYVCTAELTLPSGRAMAVFRLVVETYTTTSKLGEARQETRLVAAAPTLEEAGALLCRRGHCAPGAEKR